MISETVNRKCKLYEERVEKAIQKAYNEIAALHYLEEVARKNFEKYSQIVPPEDVFGALENAVRALNATGFGVNTGLKFVIGQKPDHFAIRAGLANYVPDERYYIGCELVLKTGMEYVCKLVPTAEGKEIMETYNRIRAGE